MTKKRVQAYIEDSISKGTLSQYQARIKNIQKYLHDSNEATLTLDVFADFLDVLKARTQNANKNTAEGYRSAVLFYQRTYGTWTSGGDCWADGWACRKMIAGFGYEGKTKGRPRGQVTPDMFSQMMIVARKSHRSFAPALELAYRVALRPHQVVSLQHGDFDGTTLLLPDKRSKATNNFPQYTRKHIIDPEAHWMLEKLEATRTGRYFDFNETDLRECLKNIGATLGWPRLQQAYDGPHCLRHGGMSHLEKLLVHRPDTTTNEILQVSPTTRARYTKPNTLR